VLPALGLLCAQGRDLERYPFDDDDFQTVTETFWTHGDGPLLEELVDCIDELQMKHEFLLVMNARLDRVAIRQRVKGHLESYERTHPGLFVCKEHSYGTRRRLSVRALQKSEEMGFSSKFFRAFEGQRTHAQLVTAVQKLLDRGVSRKELFDSCEDDGVQPFRSQAHFSSWYNGSSHATKQLDRAVDQMLWDRIDKARVENALVAKRKKQQALEHEAALRKKEAAAAEEKQRQDRAAARQRRDDAAKAAEEYKKT
jgi:hypothetical protein